MKLVHANQERMEEETGGVSYSLTEEELKDACNKGSNTGKGIKMI